MSDVSLFVETAEDTERRAVERRAVERRALDQVENEWLLVQSRLMIGLQVQERIARQLGKDKRAVIASITAQLEECELALLTIAELWRETGMG